MAAIRYAVVRQHNETGERLDIATCDDRAVATAIAAAMTMTEEDPQIEYRSFARCPPDCDTWHWRATSSVNR
jgi:hypothetical protein